MIVKVQMHVLGESVKVTDVETEQVLVEGPLSALGSASLELLRGNLPGLVGEFHAEWQGGSLRILRPVQR